MRFMVAALLNAQDASMGLASLALAAAMGLALGAVRIRGMRLGISGVLFAALLFGQAGLTVDSSVLKFLRDFALIIFIYSLGLQVGPGFISSLRAGGLRLNILSVVVLVLGTLMTAAIVRLAGLKHEASPGIYAGAFTTTPGLAAGQEALKGNLKPGQSEEKAISTAALAYSVTYPFAILGPILVIATLRRVFGVQMEAERKDLIAREEALRPPIEIVDLEVTNPEQAGSALRDHLALRRAGVIFSRQLRDGVVSVPTADTEVRVGDVFRAIGPRTGLAELVEAMGRIAPVPLGSTDGGIERKELFVTRTAVLRRSLRELDLIRRYSVTIARVNRAGIELIPRATLRLAFGDRVTAVGTEPALKHVEAELGNSPESLNRPQLVPIFLGIVLGVLVGSIPIAIPGLGTSLRIGLAGGPLLAAILLSQLGNLGSVVWYMPVAANALFRDFGLAVFLACVGLDAGDRLLQRMLHQGGLSYVFWGALVTVAPVFIIAWIARRFYRMNFITLSGWIAGAMTSSPALAFATDIAESDAPAVSYAAVAPLATLVPIICAQLLAIAL